MKEIKCTIIQDVLPLYVDEVVSQDTKEMVDEHLQYCEKCQKEYDAMKQELYIPAENKAFQFKEISKKWRKKKVIISITSVFITAIILLGAYLSVFYYETVIPYSEDLIKIERQMIISWFPIIMEKVVQVFTERFLWDLKLMEREKL